MRNTLLLLLLVIFATSKKLNYPIKKGDGKITVTVLVFSGTQNPTFEISVEQSEFIHKLIEENEYSSTPTNRALGYTGFVINSNLNDNVKIYGIPSAEIYLLSLGSDLEAFSKEVETHILSELEKRQQTPSKAVCTTINGACGNKFDACCDGSYCNCQESGCKCKSNSNVLYRDDFDCEAVPIRGVDTVPEFDVHNDDHGCFETEQWNNNCYNYSTDVLTNSFAQPGRGTQHKWVENTCEDVKRAAISDGLVWVGTDYPSKAPEQGHFVALLIWPNSNFHWIRLDSNGKWSHKPGGTPVRNTDNEGEEITDPSKQDFSPWTQFCGYFNVIPSKIEIN